MVRRPAAKQRGSGMAWIQRTIQLRPRTRGFHLITDEVVAALPEFRTVDIGLLHVFIQHTSASLAINENADPDVPSDLEKSFNAVVPEDFPYAETQMVQGRAGGQGEPQPATGRPRPVATSSSQASINVA